MSNKKNSKVKSVVVIIVLVILLFGIVTAIIALRQNGNALKTFAVKINGGDVITENVDDYEMPGDVEIKIYSLNSDIGVYIFAKETNADFAFELGGQTHSWNALVNSQRDLSDGFHLEAKSDGFTFKTSSLENILTAEFGEPVKVDNTAVPQTDLFDLIVFSGDTQIVISFHTTLVTSITLTPDFIIF
ncbi:MAG: hypothetical protein J6B04_05490 [Clostridia bacterium]|nr:hypothetical protein [Clostridia bacterium]